MSITVRDNSIVIDKVKLVTGTSHDEKTSEDCTSYNKYNRTHSSSIYDIVISKTNRNLARLVALEPMTIRCHMRSGACVCNPIIRCCVGWGGKRTCHSSKVHLSVWKLGVRKKGFDRIEASSSAGGAI